MFFIYGMRQYGRANAGSRFGVCDSCGRTAMLETYDTAKFLHLYWIPLIPVGHDKIIDACPLCGQCRKLSPRAYKKLKHKNDASLMERLRDTPNDPELVCEALRHWSMFKDETSFEKMAKLARTHMYDNPKVMKATAFGYCRLGQFSQALDIARQLPESDPVRNELIETAEAHAEVEGGEPKRPSTFSNISIILPYLVPLFIIIAIVGSQISEAHTSGKARKIWLVNGSMRPYEVQIDDTEYRIKGQTARPITLPMGQHQVQIKDSLFPIEPITFEYDIAFINRLADDKTLVLNPDRMAFLVRSHIPYVDEYSQKEAEARYEYRFGEAWYVFPSTDYPFREIPENVSMPSGASVTYKTQLTLHEPGSYLEALNVLYANDGADAIPDIVETALRLDPESPEISLLLAIAQGTNDLNAIECLKPALAQRPVLIDWHRYYQEAVESDPQHDLIAEYQALLEKEPDNAALRYLRGRIEPDFEKAMELYLSAEEGSGCGGYGHYAVAYNLMYRMQYHDAYSLLLKAMKNDGAEPRFGPLYHSACMATHSYQPLLDALKKQKGASPDDGELVAQQIRILHLMGSHDEAIQAAKTYYSINLDWMDIDTRTNWQTYYDAIRNYVDGDITAYLRKMDSILPEQTEYQRAFHEGNIQQVMNILEETETAKFSDYLLAYATAMHHGQKDVADQSLQAATDMLENRPEIANFIKDPASASPEKLTLAKILPAEKLYVALAMGCLQPEQQDAYFKIAEQCNYTPYFPWQLIKTQIK